MQFWAVISLVVILLILNIYSLCYNRKLFLTLNALFLFFLKLGFSRADHYMVYFVIPVTVLGLVMVYNHKFFSSALFIIFLIAMYDLAVNPFTNGFNGLPATVDYSQTYQNRMAQAYSMFKIDDAVVKQIGRGTIDVYPDYNEYVFANNLNYDYRPLFQNYMTLTPELDQMNQHFFESDHKPQFVLWVENPSCNGVKMGLCNQFVDMDSKYFLNEDPLTSSSILLNYHIALYTSALNGAKLALLKRNSNTTLYSQSVIARQKMVFGQWYNVPPNNSGVIKIIPHFRYTLMGKMQNILFRGDIVFISYKLANGSNKVYQINLLNSQSGIWISPYLTNFAELNGQKVVQIMFQTSAYDYLEPTFNAEWINVPIHLQNS
jgi:hypothetical protein